MITFAARNCENYECNRFTFGNALQECYPPEEVKALSIVCCDMLGLDSFDITWAKI